MNLRSCSISLIATAACVSGIDTTEPDLWTSDGITWDSGITDNLSPWTSLDCTTYGTDWRLTGLHAFANRGSADVIARLDGRCSAYAGGQQDGRHETAAIFSANPAQTGAWTEVHASAFVSQVEFEMLTARRDVQAMRLGQVDGTVESPTPWVGATSHPLDGPTVTLRCPAGDAVTGLALRYETTTGKIRTLRVTCGPLP